MTTTFVFELAPAVAWPGYEMGGIPVTEHIEGFLKFSLFNEAVTREISTRGIPRNEVLPREETLSASVVSSREVDLGQPEGIFVIF